MRAPTRRSRESDPCMSMSNDLHALVEDNSCLWMAQGTVLVRRHVAIVSLASTCKSARNSLLRNYRRKSLSKLSGATALVMIVTVLCGCAAHDTPQSSLAPEPRSIVVAAHPAAARAGRESLARGGDAIDAAIAVQTVLGLVEPQSSGIGGGAFMLYFDAESGKVTSYNGREKAPMGSTPEMFLDDKGSPLARSDAMLSGRATGVPGVLAMLERAHEDHGVLPWADAFSSAIEMSQTGFALTTRTQNYVRGDYPQSATPDVREYFKSDDGDAFVRGELFRNAAYARTLQHIAREGAAAFYRSDEIAGAIVARTQAVPLPRTMTREDLRRYAPQVGDPLCRPYRTYVVCVPPPRRAGSRCCRFSVSWRIRGSIDSGQIVLRPGFCS